MNELNESIRHIVRPPGVDQLPISPKGYPTPWFVDWNDGAPDFRVLGRGKIKEAIKKNLCWICGKPLFVRKTFTIGPMCTINRVSAEPPGHLMCATYSAKACPFLSKPKMRRNEANMPAESKSPAGIMITRNPGVTALWVTQTYKLWRDDVLFDIGRSNDYDEGVLFKIGSPIRVNWYAEGKEATREQVDESIRTGLPVLREMAEIEGPESIQALSVQINNAQKWLP